jgi:hypothetical protein
MTVEQLRKELDTYSALVSTRLRAIALGVLGISWALLLKTEEVLPLADRIPRIGLLGAIAAALVALLADLSQYLAAESAAGSAFERAALDSSRSADLDGDSFAYRAQLWCYWAKLVLTVAAAVCVVVLLTLTIA